IDTNQLDPKLFKLLFNERFASNVSAEAGAVLNYEVRDLAFALPNVVNRLIEGRSFCLPSGLPLRHEHAQSCDVFSSTPVFTTLLLGRQIQFIAFGLLDRGYAAVDNRGRSTLLSVTVVFGHETGILQEPTIARNITPVLPQPICKWPEELQGQFFTNQACSFLALRMIEWCFTIHCSIFITRSAKE